MKKFLAILLAAMLVLSMTAVAFAGVTYDDEGNPIYTDDSGDNAKTFTKTYNAAGDTAYSPAETFTITGVEFDHATDTGVGFSADWAKNNVPTFTSVEYVAGEAGSSTKTKSFVITLPEYPVVGIYTYTFKEADNNVAGVSYNSTTMYLVVTVIEDDNQHKRIAAVHCEGKDGTTKTGDFVNTYSAGTLDVTKLVEGNLGDKNKEFDIKVTFSAPDGDTVKSDITYNDGSTVDGSDIVITAGEGWTTQEVTIHVKHNETVTFENIPYGVTYTVEEADYTGNNGGYEDPNYVFSDEENKKIDSEKDTVTITNTKGQTIDTGITTDTLPYVLLMGIVLLAGAAMIIKRRAHNN